jgi:hypothetical protein
MIEIYNNNEKIDIKSISLIDRFNEEMIAKKELLSTQEIDFSSIKSLKGEKIILELSFQNEKKESLN